MHYCDSHFHLWVQLENQEPLTLSITDSPLNAGNIGAMLLVIRESVSGPLALRSIERKGELSENATCLIFGCGVKYELCAVKN